MKIAPVVAENKHRSIWGWSIQAKRTVCVIHHRVSFCGIYGRVYQSTGSVSCKQRRWRQKPKGANLCFGAKSGYNLKAHNLFLRIQMLTRGKNQAHNLLVLSICIPRGIKFVYVPVSDEKLGYNPILLLGASKNQERSIVRDRNLKDQKIGSNTTTPTDTNNPADQMNHQQQHPRVPPQAPPQAPQHPVYQMYPPVAAASMASAHYQRGPTNQGAGDHESSVLEQVSCVYS
jgi:hypothetical protein